MKLSHFLFMRAGVSETVVLNMATLAWSVVTTVQGRVPLASEVLKSTYNFSYPNGNYKILSLRDASFTWNTNTLYLLGWIS